MMDVRSLGLPVRRWVPDWLAVAALFIVILPVLMVNGAYTGSMLEVSNTLGTNTEDITMAYYAASAGMAIGYPIVPKVLSAFPAKPLLLADLVLQFFLSWICARSQNADILIVASFVIGFLKGFMMLWFIRIVKFIFSPKDVRSEFYSYFYPLVFGFGQLSMVLTAELAYHYDWKYMYYFEMALMLLSILTVIICFRQGQGQDGIADRRTASARNAGGGCRGADADVRGGLWEDARLDGLFQDSRLPGYRPHTDCLFHLVAGACRKALRQSGSLVSAQSHRGISLHDAGDVFQHVYHVAHQLYDFHLASGFRAYVPFIYMDAAGICAGGVHLLLVVQVATGGVSASS